MGRNEISIFLAIIMLSASFSTVSIAEGKLSMDFDISDENKKIKDPETIKEPKEKKPKKMRVIETENITAYARSLYTTVDNPDNHESGFFFDGVSRLSLPSSDGNTYGCSGSLLSTGKHVLTAAHCVTDNNGVVNLLSGGTATFHRTLGTEIIGIAGVTVHSSYDGDFLKGNDIAILELSNIASSDVTRYDYATNDNSIGQVLQKIGYGISGKFKTGENVNQYPFGTKRDDQNKYDAFADVMYQALAMQPFVDYVPQAIYQYDSDDGKSQHDAFGFFFNMPDLGLGNNEVMSASGDSGGPTLSDTNNDGSLDTVVGITSYGITLQYSNGNTSDCTKQAQNAFLDSSCGEFAGDTRVSQYADWISGVITPTKFLEIKGDPKTSPPTTYRIIVSGQIMYGPQANPPDDMLSLDGTTIDGTVNPSRTDNYYFTGNIISITADQHLSSFVDGVEVSNNSPPLTPIKFLEIKGVSGTTSFTTYQVIVSDQISYGPQANPPGDMLSSDGTTIDGKVKPPYLDNYYFSGDIDLITADQHIFSFVDGVYIPNSSPILEPVMLLEIIADPVTSTPITYQVMVSGEIFYGPQANPPNDLITTDGTTTNGIVRAPYLDNYYFTGNVDLITADQHVISRVNGIEIPNNSSPP